MNGKRDDGDRGRSPACGPSASRRAREAAATSTSRWWASRIRCASSGRRRRHARLADWNKDFALVAPAKEQVVDYGRKIAAAQDAEREGSTVLRPSCSSGPRLRDRWPSRERGWDRDSGVRCAPPAEEQLRAARQGSAGASSRGVGSGAAAASRPASRRLPRAHPRGSSRSTRHSRAQRSAIGSASGALSRLPFSSSTAASQPHRAGASSTTARGPDHQPPALVLAAHADRRAPPSVNRGPRGCSRARRRRGRPHRRATRATATAPGPPARAPR